MATLVNFVVKDLAGNVVRKGVCDERTIDVQEVGKDETFQVVAVGEIVETGDRTAGDEKIYHYTFARFENYPDAREQLGAIWEILSAFEDQMPTKAKLVYDRVMAVKDQFPKDKRFLKKADGSYVPYEEDNA